MIAFLFLRGNERIFEGGTGTGYQTAILANLCQHVYTVERNLKRLEAAKERLASLGISFVPLVSPHSMGWTLVNGDYVPSALKEQKRRRFPWNILRKR
jgi:protein-L-isoaspartate(D-aspartate) O-methyltransferase